MLLWASHFCDFCHVLCEQSRLKQEDENWVSSCQLLEVKGSLLRRESEEGLKQGLPSLVSCYVVSEQSGLLLHIELLVKETILLI